MGTPTQPLTEVHLLLYVAGWYEPWEETLQAFADRELAERAAEAMNSLLRAKGLHFDQLSKPEHERPRLHGEPTVRYGGRDLPWSIYGANVIVREDAVPLSDAVLPFELELAPESAPPAPDDCDLDDESTSDGESEAAQ